MRLIDADELRKNVLKWMPSDPCGKEEKEFPFETDICVSMIMEIDETPTIEPEQRWIPVEERLPEPWDLVLVTDRCKDVRVCQMHHNSSDGWYDECDNWMYFSTSVIAWMPLPEYYQEKDGEQE